MDYNIQKDKTIIIESKSKVKQIKIENIIYISCDSYVLNITVTNQKEVENVLMSLAKMEQHLFKYHFFRINRSQLVNMKYFISYDIGSGRLTLFKGEVLKISRKKWSQIKYRLIKQIDRSMLTSNHLKNK